MSQHTHFVRFMKGYSPAFFLLLYKGLLNLNFILLLQTSKLTDLKGFCVYEYKIWILVHLSVSPSLFVLSKITSWLNEMYC